MKAYIANGWDKRIVDPDPEKQYTRKKILMNNIQLHQGQIKVFREMKNMVWIIGQRDPIRSKLKEFYHHC